MFVLFDLDDTVHDKTASYTECAKSMFNQYMTDFDIDIGKFVDSFVRENCIIQPKATVFQKLAEEFSIDVKVQNEMLIYFDESFHKYAKRYDFVLETMQKLNDLGVKMACVTNGRDFFQRNKIEALGLKEFFEVIVTSGELSVKKPDPIIFNRALELLNADASDSVFIGDNLRADMEPAKNLGMRTIWVNSEETDFPSYVDFQLKSYSEFVDIWQAITRR